MKEEKKYDKGITNAFLLKTKGKSIKTTKIKSLSNKYFNQIEPDKFQLGLCYFYSAIHVIAMHPTLLYFLFYPNFKIEKNQDSFQVNLMLEDKKVMTMKVKILSCLLDQKKTN